MKIKSNQEQRAYKASTTIEAAVIIPVFVIMIVNFILIAFVCHDRAVYNAIAVKGGVVAEFGAKTEKEYNSQISEVNSKINAYMAEKMIGKSQTCKLGANILEITSEGSIIAKNDPVEFTWLTDAAKNLLGKGA